MTPLDNLTVSAALWAVLGIACLTPVQAVAQGTDTGCSPARSSTHTLDAAPVSGGLDVDRRPAGVAPGGGTRGGFDGLFAQLGIGFANAQSQLDFPGWLHLGVNDNSLVGEGAAGYSQAFGRFNLAARAFYTLGDQKAGSFTDSGFQASIQLRLQNTWGVSVEPGFTLDESTLVYASLGYVGTKARFLEYDSQGTFPWERRLNGFSVGAGLKYTFTPSIYGVAELRFASFQTSNIDFGGVYPQASFKPNSLNGTVGVGYRF